MKKAVRLTRARTKISFKVPAKCTPQYMGSPYYKGTLLWNVLEAEVQKSATVIAFKSKMRKLYPRYQEIW